MCLHIHNNISRCRRKGSILTIELFDNLQMVIMYSIRQKMKFLCLVKTVRILYWSGVLINTSVQRLQSVAICQHTTHREEFIRHHSIQNGFRLPFCALRAV